VGYFHDERASKEHGVEGDDKLGRGAEHGERPGNRALGGGTGGAGKNVHSRNRGEKGGQRSYKRRLGPRLEKLKKTHPQEMQEENSPQ